MFPDSHLRQWRELWRAHRRNGVTMIIYTTRGCRGAPVEGGLVLDAQEMAAHDLDELRHAHLSACMCMLMSIRPCTRRCACAASTSLGMRTESS